MTTVSLMHLTLDAHKWRALVESLKEGESLHLIEGRAYIIHPASVGDVERIEQGILVD